MITLINGPGLKIASGIQLQTPAPSIGLAYLGAFLKSKGLEYQAIDACGEALDQIRRSSVLKNVLVQGLSNKEILERVPADTKIIGISCLFSFAWPIIATLVRDLRKEFPDALIVAGGEHSSALPSKVLENGDVDLVIDGEGEETFYELCTCIQAKRPWFDIDGIVFKTKDGKIHKNNPRKRVVNIDAFPYPDWDNWCIENYIDHGQVTGIKLGRSMPILGSRGCPYSCTFCSSPQMWTTRYIMRDPKKLVDEMDYMKAKYGVSGFAFMDSTFIVNRRKVLAFTKELIDRKLEIVYQLPAGTRCEAINDELAKHLAKSGLKNFALAPESGSEEMLAVMKKQIKLKDFFSAIRSILKTNMTVCVFTLIGLPEETRESLKQTLKFIRKIAWLGVHDLVVNNFTPYPGSENYERLKKEGAISDDGHLSNIISYWGASNPSFNPNFSQRELFYWLIYMQINFYVLSFLRRPWRVVGIFFAYFRTGIERTRYMRLISELFVVRKRWRAASLASASG